MCPGFINWELSYFGLKSRLALIHFENLYVKLLLVQITNTQLSEQCLISAVYFCVSLSACLIMMLIQSCISYDQNKVVFCKHLCVLV